MQPAHDLAEQLLWRAQSADDPARLMFAHKALGFTSYQMGQLLLARQHIEMAISLYDRERHRLLAFRFAGLDSEVQCLAYLGYTLWTLGYPDQALKRVNEAVGLAQALSHPFSLAFAEVFTGFLHQYRLEARAAQEHSETVIALCVKHGFTGLVGPATALRGAAMAQLGRREEGIAQMREGLAASRPTGSNLSRPHYLTRLAEAYMQVGRLDDGLSALTEASVAADENEQRQNESEIHRVKGELLLRQEVSNAAEARNCFERSIEIARKQSAKTLELRATMSLVRLLASEGKRDKARTMLAEIYGWFTEGFDTADLKDAKALLDELSR
jgi:predicted ATPase